MSSTVFNHSSAMRHVTSWNHYRLSSRLCQSSYCHQKLFLIVVTKRRSASTNACNSKYTHTHTKLSRRTHIQMHNRDILLGFVFYAPQPPQKLPLYLICASCHKQQRHMCEIAGTLASAWFVGMLNFTATFWFFTLFWIVGHWAGVLHLSTLGSWKSAKQWNVWLLLFVREANSKGAFVCDMCGDEKIYDGFGCTAFGGFGRHFCCCWCGVKDMFFLSVSVCVCDVWKSKTLDCDEWDSTSRKETPAYNWY